MSYYQSDLIANKVTRKFTSFPIADPQQTKLQMLNWANQFNICCFLDNNGYDFAPHTVECLLAVDPVRSLNVPAGNALNELSAFYAASNDWLFGHLSYDLKNETENSSSHHPDQICFPDIFFFVPRILVRLTGNEISIGTINVDQEIIFRDIMSTDIATPVLATDTTDIRNRFSKEEYLQTIGKLQQHILRGDCYEINFCQEFYVENITIDPLNAYHALSNTSPNPFSAYYKLDDRFLLCASPERYLKKQGSRIISQPIKGTSQRDIMDDKNDLENKNLLYKSSKDRSENVMVVDLVRNDLSRICEEGSVTVDELFGIYSFPQVHQMVSTISGNLRSDLDWVEAIRATFPMGSMTGAPKRKVIELIEQYEKTKRGIFSGALGYITPEADFDFNVIIRSLLYNRTNRYLSFPAGSGITFYSNPENEYEECLIKVAAIKKIIEHG